MYISDGRILNSGNRGIIFFEAIQISDNFSASFKYPALSLLCTKTIPFFMQTFKNDFYSKIALTKDEFFNMLVTQGIRKATKKAGLTTVLQNRISSL